MRNDQDIQDAIEHGSLDEAKLAIRLKLKSAPSDPFYLALDALAASRSGQWQVAHQKGLLASARTPSDPRALSTIYEVFRRPLNRAQLGLDENSIPLPASVFENAIKKYPIVGEKLAKSWLQCAIPSFDDHELSRVFNALSRVSKDSPQYRWWLAMGYLWLVDGDVSDRDRLLYSKLAYRMLRENEASNLMELWLQLEVAAAANEPEFIETLDIPQNTFTDLTVQLLYCGWLRRAQKWPQLFQYCLSLIHGGFDDYDTWTWLIEAAGKEDALLKVSEAISAVPPSRNTYLVGILLAKALGNSIEPALNSYFEKYVSKLCCFPDILRYFEDDSDLIDRELWDNRFNDLFNEIMVSHDRRNTKDLITIVNVQKFLYTLHHDDNEWVSEFMARNWTLYAQFRPQLATFDPHPASQLALMLVLVGLHRDHSYPVIVRLAVILVQLLEADPHNPMLMLWVMKLTSFLNTNNLAPLYYNRLKIKMIQHDTLGHYYLPANPSKDHLAEQIRMFQFFITGDREIHQSIEEGLLAGVYSKIRGFVTLGGKLAKLYSRHIVALSVIRLCLMLNDYRYLGYFTNHLRVNHDKFLGDKIDNRDYNIEYQALGMPHLRIPHLSAPIARATQEPHLSTYIELAVHKYMSLFGESESVHWIEKYNEKVVRLMSSGELVTACDLLVHRLTAALFKYHNKKSFSLEYARARKFLLKHLDFLLIQPFIEEDPTSDTLQPLEDSASSSAEANPIYTDNLETPRARNKKLPSLIGWHFHYNLQNIVEVIKIGEVLANRSGDLGLRGAMKKLSDKLVKAKYGEKQRQELSGISVDSIPAECTTDPDAAQRTLGMFGDSVQESLDAFLKF